MHAGISMRFGLYANPRTAGLKEVLQPIIEFLGSEKRSSVIYEKELAEYLGKSGLPFGELDVDILVTVGGDGTILRAFQSCDLPVFAVHAGNVGFLTTVGYSEAIQGLKRVLEGNYTIEEKLRLKVLLNDKRLPDCTNELTVHTSQIAKIRSYAVDLDGQTVAHFRADGMIISTPTGSTSYAMSNGGPILAPGVEAFVLAPIAPYKLSSRPYVLPPDGNVTVRLLDGDRTSLLVLDGQFELEVDGNDAIHITKSERRSHLVNFGLDFFERVNLRLDH